MDIDKLENNVEAGARMIGLSMDNKTLNLVALKGKLAAPAEYRESESGFRYLRVLITVRGDGRVDVIPVTIHDPSDEQVEASKVAGVTVLVFGRMRRRFSAFEGRRSHLDVVARLAVIGDLE
jgi:hypothetical protein